MTEDETVGWHHTLDGHEFEQTLADRESQGNLACCSPWGCKQSDMTGDSTTTPTHIPSSQFLSSPPPLHYNIRINYLHFLPPLFSSHSTHSLGQGFDPLTLPVMEAPLSRSLLIER